MIFSTAKWEPTPLERELRAVERSFLLEPEDVRERLATKLDDMARLIGRGDDGAVHFYTQVARILRTGDPRPEFR